MRETIRLTLRGYKIWWRENPQMLIAPALCSIAETVSPYVSVWLLAQLINEIAGQKDRQRMIALTFALLVSAALLTLLGAALDRWKNVQWADMWHVQNRIINRKLLSMDFAGVEHSRT